MKLNHISRVYRMGENKLFALSGVDLEIKDGEIGKFYRGYEMIPQNYDGVIVPYFIDGTFGSVFSKYKPQILHMVQLYFKYIEKFL